MGLAAGLSQLPSFGSGVPHAYLRLLVYQADSTVLANRIVPITSAALTTWEPVVLPQLVLPTGAAYAQVYVANESNVPVWFDDVKIEHWQGLQVQENHYDPFGLDLAGLSRSTPGLRTLNQYQWNGKEKQSDFGLGWTHLDWRFFDPQTGRFHTVDPLSDNGQEMWSTYQFGFDNAVRYNDPDGRCPRCPPGVVSMLMPIMPLHIYNTIVAAAVSWAGSGSEEDISYAQQHPINALRVLPIRTIATTVAEDVSIEPKGSTGNGSLTNALRHGLGQAMAIRDLGEKLATEAADKHEGTNAGVLKKYNTNVQQLMKNGQTTMPLGEADSFVDQLNNKAGRAIGAANPTATDAQLGSLTVQALGGNNPKLPTLYKYDVNDNAETVTVTPTHMSPSLTQSATERIATKLQ